MGRMVVFLEACKMINEKKMLLGFIVVMVCLASCALEAVELPLINPSFEDSGVVELDTEADWDQVPGWSAGPYSGPGNAGVWGPEEFAGDGDYYVWTNAAIGNIYQMLDHVIVAGGEYTVEFMGRNDSDTTDIIGEFYYHPTDDPDSPDDHQVIATITSPLVLDAWSTYILTFATEQGQPYIGKRLGVQFRALPTGGNSWWWLDGVKVTAEILVVSNRQPEDGAENVEPAVVLSWNAPTQFEAESYNVYLGSDPNMTDYISLEQTETFFDPEPDLDYNTTYYWLIEALEPNDIGYIVHDAGICTFTTVSAIPVVLKDPVSVVIDVDAGEKAVFTVAGANTDNYTWKKVSDGSVVLSGADANSLTIEDVELADEDFYYCELSNDEGTATSASAGLWLKRLISHWAFEDNLEDSSESEKDGIFVGTDPNYAPGIDEQALELFSDTRYVEIPDAAFYNFYPLGYTISFWVNCSSVDGDPALSKVEEDGSAGYSIYPDSGGVPAAYLEGAGDGRTVAGTIAVNDQQWHHLVFEYDAALGRQLLYIDGVLDATSSLITDVVPTTDEPIRIGVWGPLAEAPYEGLIDDLRIYSYPVDAYEVAHMYTFFEKEKEVCVENPEFDLSGPEEIPDCRVDIFDVAALAAGWLECNIVPTCK